VVDPEDAVLGVVAALKGVYRKVCDEVVVVAVGQTTAERVARTADDLVLEAVGQNEVVFVGGSIALKNDGLAPAWPPVRVDPPF
jgi:hypothetical protein